VADTTIEWTDRVWNPTTGCDRVSPGCDNCYALTMAKRLKGMGQAKYQTDGDPRTSGPGFGLQVHPDVLDQPLRWRKPARVFVNSMSDLFHPRVPDDFIAQVFGVMATADQHTFQVLTKRPKRMRALLSNDRFWHLVEAEWRYHHDGRGMLPSWVLPNVWLGTSVEDQQRAEERIPALLDTPAAVRFLSCEPLLGPVDLAEWLDPPCDDDPDGLHYYGCGDDAPDDLHWVIVGGESGPGHRPMDPAWARGLRDQCVQAGVAFFFKQHGGARPKANGRELDGRTWDEMPAVTP
jgi:protein gp37